MTYFSDLSLYTYDSCDSSQAVNVGWLEKGQPFPVGETSEDFRVKLAKLCQQAGRRRVGQIEVYVGTCGTHGCDFCSAPSAVSSTEIRIRGSIRVYAAPQLIHHYVAAHGYLPPSEFIDAVVAWDGDLYEEPEHDLSSWKRRRQSARRLKQDAV
jgi:hypothetical protein